ncbi:hypothetical protein ACVH9Z_39105 [Rhodococcus opacus]
MTTPMRCSYSSVARPAEQMPEGFLLDVTVTDVKALLPLLKVPLRVVEHHGVC